jgi:hypothetical protein
MLRAKSKGARALSGSLYSKLQEALIALSSNTSEYPPTLARVFERAGEPIDRQAMEAVAFSVSLRRYLRTSAKASRGKPLSYFAHALAFLPHDNDRVASSVELLYSVLRMARTSTANIFPLSALVERVPTFLEKPFAKTLQGHIDQGMAPPGVGIVYQKVPQFFLFEHAVLGPILEHGAGHENGAPRRTEPTAPPAFGSLPPAFASPLPAFAAPAPDGPGVELAEFERDFQSAFERLDVQSGKHNYVLLHDLRRALPDIPRIEFDERLNDLRRNKLFSLDSADGRHVRLTPEQLDAGIREANSLLVYVARR